MLSISSNPMYVLMNRSLTFYHVVGHSATTFMMFEGENRAQRDAVHDGCDIMLGFEHAYSELHYVATLA